MAMIFPSPMINDIRKAATTGQPIQKRDIRFPGNYLSEPRIVPSPGKQRVGKVTVPIWCGSCGGELTDGMPVISVEYDAHPGQGQSDPATHYIHVEKCQHVGG
jgi:hypothetical protein